MREADGIPAKKLEAMQVEGYLPTAKANLELTECLEKIKVRDLFLGSNHPRVSLSNKDKLQSGVISKLLMHFVVVS